ncbi:zinc finger protein 286A-like [Cydia fagiglandana]|uniref:zinc finger protein 286A-like n=1 Tax=Cydia fagiglandana TaxID=1458189 RepID=UPI002FEE2FFF
MSLKSVKSGSEWSGGSSEVLYEGHEIKQEIVLGPIVLQRSDLTHKLNDQSKLVRNNKSAIDAPALGTDEMVRLASENINSDYGQNKAHINQADMAPAPSIKREPIDDELLLVADLGTDEMVRLGLTPETMGADYEIYRNKLTADIKKEVAAPTSTVSAPQSAASVVPASHVDAVKEELLKDEVADCENGLYRRSRRINKQRAETEKQELIKYSSKLTFETDSEDKDTDSEYDEKKSKREDTSDGDEKPNLNVNKIKKVERQKKRHICDFCSKEFNFRAGLTNHIRTHTGEKPYTCKTCPKKFSDYAVLVRHRRMHAGLKPHVCDICGKKYSEKYLLKNHKLVHTGEMQYFCKLCPKKFVNSSNYRRHQKLHMHKYECDMCNKRFEKKDKLVSHIINHMKPKPFTCKFCKKGFFQIGHLNRHLVIHLGAKETYKCGSCKQKFTQNASLKRHIEKNVCKKKVFKK